MPSVRTLLARVQRLETARTATPSPIVQLYGSVAAFEADVLADIAAGKLDRDFPIEGLRRWEAEKVYDRWHRGKNRQWEMGA